jgi:hypothetical protein
MSLPQLLLKVGQLGKLISRLAQHEEELDNRRDNGRDDDLPRIGHGSRSTTDRPS